MFELTLWVRQFIFTNVQVIIIIIFNFIAPTWYVMFPWPLFSHTYIKKIFVTFTFKS